LRHAAAEFRLVIITNIINRIQIVVRDHSKRILYFHAQQMQALVEGYVASPDVVAQVKKAIGME
jgi:hypothetical protein